MKLLDILEIVSGILWASIGIIIVVWLLIPSDELLTALWWCFAVGCTLTGIWLVADPILRLKEK